MVTTLTMSLPVAVELDTPVHSVNSSIPADARFEKVRGNLRFPIRKGAFFSATLVLIVVLFGFLLWVVTQLRCIFRSLTRGTPFTAENSRRIRWVGFAAIFGELVRAAVVFSWSYYLSRHLTANGTRFIATTDVNGAAILSGLAILVIAEVFREGTRLQEDQSLTI